MSIVPQPDVTSCWSRFVLDALMRNRDLVILPAPPRKNGLWLVGALVLGLTLVAPAVYLLANYSVAPEPAIVAALPHPQSVPVPRPRPEFKAAAAPASAKTAVPVLAPLPPTAEAVSMRSTQGPVPVHGWLLEPASSKSLTTGSINSRMLVTYVNRDVDGFDYQVLRNKGLADCEDACKSDGRCRAYTFNKWENVCFLKSSVTVTRIEPRGISGVLSSEALRAAERPPTIARLSSRRFPGSPYRSLARTDYDSCANACAADSLCLGVNFGKLDGSCALIATLDKSVPDNRTEAGMKWQAPIVVASEKRRRGPSPRDLSSEAAAIFDSVVGQILR
jgi:hypothetical protein